ncbi:DUF1501 domain-containing protein [Tuwongella immobilis]|uniref:DUF1501 domain-containing protein n=1 Tax=Tuwongella immobilis TaxID=692036 RepID=A0A6C2YQP3_9BACT|nr:DUF1501 domain-containing protein [Tuwongella immobilis]VIP03479.1 protein containing duf1501 : Uncharacterized protein OS=Singulisphaera acidiphila (strain ATCC BAA-1392 / DSM 18658 / VKM B-2454 / MOB10) GN=Sinac_0050 PE=4 SV=1: DUF1501 [Tuwongella immobilis]VTS04328.1 protein containing duf1501 : Uncharacterized protein OS=Singulisphaera acidiphila (strain ATCC BAA-1392 / DSM 18658 / VKM B-2454 / MOB10) GN=Sinac_0050 PE=4 SV=1: DUF1501 [Tuwongella immobilis]
MSASNRREFLRAGLTGFGSLSLPGLLRSRAMAATPASERTAIILVWLRGGCSHLDTYDPKPDSPAEYRSPYAPISTSVPGMRLTELLPMQAKRAHRFALLRSLTHTGGGHPAGSLQVLSGDPDPIDKLKPVRPDFMTVAHYLRGGNASGLPNYVGVNPVVRYDSFTIAGPGYLSANYSPFVIGGDPNSPQFRVQNVGITDPQVIARIRDRSGLREQLDTFRRELDRSGIASTMDQFESQAIDLMTSPAAARAFDLTLEDSKIRDRYGRNQWGQQLLMARRLVEAGVEIVTTTLDGPLCGRVQNWDDHAVNHHIFDALKYRAPFFDQGVSALIDDIYDRGLDRKVMVVVTGEFGRTPRISRVASSGAGVASAAAGTEQPGRDHWPQAGSMIWFGGGIKTGQVIGATDARGEQVVERRMSPHDFLATIYAHLGIDYKRVTVPDLTGRPNLIVDHGEAFPELTRSAT